MRPLPNLGAGLALGAALALGACSASNVGDSRDFAVPAGGYAAAFEATRDTLRGLDFELDRIDAASGVITTKPHFAQGLFEPWDRTQSSLTDEWEDAMNAQAREVRVTFEPAQPGDSPPDQGLAPDLREAEGELRASVRVTVFRRQRTGRRLDSEWVGGSSFYTDPLLQPRTGASYLVPFRRDEKLEARLASLIAEASTPIGTAPSAE